MLESAMSLQRQFWTPLGLKVVCTYAEVHEHKGWSPKIRLHFPWSLGFIT
jgi:hypothetical protein